MVTKDLVREWVAEYFSATSDEVAFEYFMSELATDVELGAMTTEAL